MTSNVVSIQSGRLTLSRITFHCDLQKASGLKVPLGVIAEISMGNIRSLGLIARTELKPNESNGIGILLKQHLANPFNYLRTEFEWAWGNSAPGDALAKLSDRHSTSLFFAPAAVTTLRKACSPTELLDFVRRELRERRDSEFDLLLAESWGGSTVSPTEDTARAA